MQSRISHIAKVAKTSDLQAMPTSEFLANPITSRFSIFRIRFVGIQVLTVMALIFGTTTWLNADLRHSSESQRSNGKMRVRWKSTLPMPPKHVLIHFHGAPTTLVKAFERSRSNAVLVIVNFPGLSTAYSKPFETESTLLQQILDRAMAAVGKQSTEGEDLVNRTLRWERISLSSFSAGYGAVREILKSSAHFSIIDDIVAADSIYASLQSHVTNRRVDEHDMHGFLQFAKQAADSKKRFTISHSALPTPYASTTETANYLLETLDIQRGPNESVQSDGFTQQSAASRGQFIVLSFEGTTGAAHMQHLHNVDLLWNTITDREATSQPAK